MFLFLFPVPGALLLALLYFDSGGLFLAKDPPSPPLPGSHHIPGADLGRLLAFVIDAEVRRAASAARSFSRRADALAGGMQRSRQFQRHANSVLTERRQRASSVVTWLASLTIAEQESALAFSCDMDMVSDGLLLLCCLLSSFVCISIWLSVVSVCVLCLPLSVPRACSLGQSHTLLYTESWSLLFDLSSNLSQSLSSVFSLLSSLYVCVSLFLSLLEEANTPWRREGVCYRFRCHG